LARAVIASPLNTEALQKAVDACHAQKGGTDLSGAYLRDVRAASFKKVRLTQRRWMRGGRLF